MDEVVLICVFHFWSLSAAESGLLIMIRIVHIPPVLFRAAWSFTKSCSFTAIAKIQLLLFKVAGKRACDQRQPPHVCLLCITGFFPTTTVLLSIEERTE